MTAKHYTEIKQPNLNVRSGGSIRLIDLFTNLTAEFFHSRFDGSASPLRGRTERRHAITTEFVLIGKEANRVGDSGETDPIVGAVEEFNGPGASDI